MIALAASLIDPATATAIAGAIAALAGIGMLLVARRTSKLSERIADTKTNAELARAEVEGWKTLIGTLREQYIAVVKDAAELRGLLDGRNEQVDRLGLALRDSREQVVMLNHRIETLRDAVTKLGGDVELINRHGKTGEKGPPGDPGPPGPPGPAA